MTNNHPSRDKLRASHVRLYKVVEYVVLNSAEVLQPGSTYAFAMLRDALIQAKELL